MSTVPVIGITPFEQPDVQLALALAKAEAFPVLHTGRSSEKANEALQHFTQQSAAAFGVCFPATTHFQPEEIALPAQVTLVIAPFGSKLQLPQNIQLFYQVHSLEQAMQAQAAGAAGIVVKGNEAGGLVGDASTFILFQQVIQALKGRLTIWVQGGIGIHNAAALTALGAQGVVLDSQLVLFPECQAPKALKTICEKLNGNETKVIDHYRVLLRPNSPALPENARLQDVTAFADTFDVEKGYLPMGQDITLSPDLSQRYKKLSRLVFALREAMHGHLKQAKALNVISAGNPLAASLNITYPIAQGPMTRVSDVPAFAAAVAEAGALPFVALSLLKGEKARQLIRETRQLAGSKTWGVGILGFAPPELRAEQIGYILEEKPPVVLIAGGTPAQAKSLEQAGIPSFLHVPSASLLDMFIKEGAGKFVFEGRECGGHVGPLSSLVLWEKQINRLLLEENLDHISVFFAGGIHDALSAAFIAVMAAPLAARGAKTGVLMGTAYLYTEEAVATGAILPQFQEQAILQNSTALLETAPGHETRCLHTPFVQYFQEEKARLLAGNIPKKEIWAQLESLNVGRLRIAAKGIERRGDALHAIPGPQQFSTGMYMIGQVAALRNKVVTMAGLHHNVAAENFSYIREALLPDAPVADSKALNIAIVGMACIYPGAKNVEEFWRNIILGTDAITEVPDERWNKELYYDAGSTNGEKTPSKWGGFIPRIDFDPVAFGIPPQSLAAIEPTQLLSLLVAKQALDNAGYGSEILNRDNVSVIIGTESGNDLASNYTFRSLFTQFFGELPAALDAALPRMTEDSFPGVLANVTSGRITNRLDLGGRNYTVDAACASSLAAVDLACQELLLEKSDMVLAGAADLHNGICDYLMFSSTKALSAKGRCSTFDAGADGIALGEGIAMLVLKRYDDAKRDGDTIYAVIKGTGGSSDGKALGLTAPRRSGQVKALERAYEQAGCSPSAVGLIEAHGTGTVVGDKTELSALSELMLHAGALAQQTSLGSVKTQIGHTKCAAGMAGLIKAALAVYHGVKPPTLHLTQPNAYYKQATSPFAFNTVAGTWNNAHRLAGISAFGFGGTNFHVVIENDRQAAANESFSILDTWPAELLVFRGSNLDAAHKQLQHVRSLLQQNDGIDLKDIAYSLHRYSNEPVQLCIVADDAPDLLLKIELALSGAEAKGVYPLKPLQGKVAFLFPGQGSQRVNMARDVFVSFPALRNWLKQYPHYEQLLFPPAVFDEAALAQQKERIKDTRVAQPLLGMVDMALASLLQTLGIAPDMVAGHSYGELPALCFAKVFAPEQLVPLSERRAKAILDAIETDKGMMVAVSCAAAEIDSITALEPGVHAVNHNSPQQWVLAGATAAMERLMERLKEKKISFRQLEVACAFHSPLLAKSKNLYQAAISDIPFHEPAVQVWSNTTAAPYPTAPAAIKERLTDHLVQPVLFTSQVQEMYAQGARVFIETGPGKVLTGLAKHILGKDELLLHTEEKDQNGITHLLHLLGRYIASGRSILLDQLFAGRKVQQLDLDQPAKHARRSTVWFVNGHMALPAAGKLPAHGAMPVVTPLQWTTSANTTTPAYNMPANNTDQIVQEYLNNIKHLIQAQRDVLLGYLGTAPQAAHNFPPAQPLPLPVASAAPAAIPVTAPVVNGSAGQPALQQPAAAPVVDLQSLLLGIVSDKTGYPVDMLGMHMDMEADLSIDSIKRMEIIGELKTRLGGLQTGNDAPVADQLANIKTLHGLLSWLQEHTSAFSPAPAAPQPVSTPAQTATAQHEASATAQPHSFTLNANDLKQLLLNVVSEKTGYPVDMLGMELDLEADLSIDSIKRMEIIGELKTKTGFAAGEHNSEQLAALKTLQALVNWMAETLTRSFEPVKEAQKIIEEGFHQHTTKAPQPLQRLRLQLTPLPLRKGSARLLEGQRFAITNNGSAAAAAIKTLLEQQGATARLIGPNDAAEPYNGLVILDLFDAPAQPSIIESVELMKQLAADQIKWVYVLSDFDAHFNEQPGVQALRRFQGFTGFIKSIAKEWEQAQCRTIHLHDKTAAQHMAGILLDELLHADQHVEVVYKAGTRYVAEPVAAPLAVGSMPRIQLAQPAVVLVLGGAQGITAELMIRFSEEYPCHFILVGRSAGVLQAVPDDFSSLQTKEQIKQRLIAVGSNRKPAEIEQQTQEIHKRNQMRNTIAALEQNGATVSYHSLDVRDEAALKQLVHQVYREHGRIDGVVHGAGLLEDKLFQHKTPESFERVFATKVNPLRVLAEQLQPDTQFVVLFSSVASVYGNRGQTDYAAANSVLDQYAAQLNKKIKGKVLAINWGPWKGTGMVSPSLEREYERRGIALIPLAEGREAFMNELKYGTEHQVVIMA